MKAVLIGTDFLKDVDGSFKAIEINTNIAIVAKDLQNYIHIEEFEQFLSDNGIDTIELIGKPASSNNVFDLDANRDTIIGDVDLLAGYLFSHFSGSLTMNHHNVQMQAITVPNVEDAPNKLILRTAYDTTALIDDTYARDNCEFLKLMYDNDPSSIPATYVNDSTIGFDSIGNTIRDNNGFPNYIIKERFSTSNKIDYPKVLKVNSVEDLTSLKQSLTSNEYLQEYIYNPSDTLEGKFKTYRTITMVYGSNLDTFDLMNPYVHTNATAPLEVVDYGDNGVVQIWERPHFVQKTGDSNSVFYSKTYHFDGTSNIILNDGSFTNISELSIGDSLLTLDIDGMAQDEDKVLAWTGSYTDITNNVTTIPTNVEHIESKRISKWLKNITLTDGTMFSDIESSVLMIKHNDSDVVGFKQFNSLNEGDTIVLFNTSTNLYENKIIESINYYYDELDIYTLDVEPTDTFLTMEENINTPIYAMIQHNPPSFCDWWCCNGPVSIEECLSDFSGYCGATYTYDYCTQTNPSGFYYCYQCLSACGSNCGGIIKY